MRALPVTNSGAARTQSLGRVQPVPEDEAESPGFVRRFDPKMELADIEIAAWRGEYLVDQLRSPTGVQNRQKGPAAHGTTEHS